MVLHLAPKKSYHPARRENIERVKRDEAEAQRQQELEELQSLQADSQARLELLRKHAGERAQSSTTLHADTVKREKKRRRLDAGEAELEAQLGANGWQVSKEAQRELSEAQASRAVILRPEVAQDTNGHINFWADMEKGLPPTLSAGNEEYAKEKKKADDKWDEQITMYLGKPAKELKPWYGERDLTNGEDRKKTQDQLLEAAYKDEELKRMSDPLAMMSSFLKKRKQIQAAQEKARLDPWASTPLHTSADHSDGPSLLRPKQKYGEEPAYKRHIKANIEKGNLQDDYGPARPRPASVAQAPAHVDSKPTLEERTRERVDSERQRAKALKDAAKKKKRMDSETPRTEYSYQDQYNKRETKEAHRWQARRWDDYRR